MDKYKYLLDQAKKAKAFPEEFRKDSFKVDGCQAQVWLVPFTEEEKLYFHSDSDTKNGGYLLSVLNVNKTTYVFKIIQVSRPTESSSD